MFVFLLVCFQRFLEQLRWLRNICNEIFEKADLATHPLETTLQVITNYRNKFSEAKQEAIDVAETWGIEVKY